MNNEEFQKIVLAKFDSMEKRFDSVDQRFDVQDRQIEENTQILKALVHASEVHKADIDKITIDVAHIKGDVTAIKKDLFTVETMTVKNYADIIQLRTVGNKS